MEKFEVRLVGFYDELRLRDSKVGQGSIWDSIRPKGPPDEAFISTYLTNGHRLMDDHSIAHDVVDNQFRASGGSEILTDGLRVWRGDLFRYVDRYHVRLPADFTDRVRGLNYRVPQDGLVRDPEFWDEALRATGWA